MTITGSTLDDFTHDALCEAALLVDRGLIEWSDPRASLCACGARREDARRYLEEHQERRALRRYVNE